MKEKNKIVMVWAEDNRVIEKIQDIVTRERAKAPGRIKTPSKGEIVHLALQLLKERYGIKE